MKVEVPGATQLQHQTVAKPANPTFEFTDVAAAAALVKQPEEVKEIQRQPGRSQLNNRVYEE